MKPKTKIQKEVARLSANLRPISATQIDWAYRHCVEHIGYRTKKGNITCSDCGHEWHSDSGLCDTLEGCTCPKCHAELKVQDTRRRIYKETQNFSVITTCKGYQVIRVAQVRCESRKGEPMRFYCHEVVQRWISPDGKVTDMALLRGFLFCYCDVWALGSDMEVRPHNSLYDDVVARSCAYPKMRILPQLRRNGFKGDFHGISPVRLFKALLSDPRIETLMKGGEIEVMKHFLFNTRTADECWASYLIAKRHKYQIDNLSMWCDYLRMLKKLGQDLRNPKNICPEDFMAALETNRMLDKMRVRINRHYQEIMERDNFVTAEKVKNAFLGLEHRYHTLMQVFRQHNEDYEKQVEAGMKAKGTLLKYRTVYKHMQEFLDIRYHVKDIALKELTPAFISDFEMFLRTDKHCCTNTVWLYVCPLRTMVFIAINNEWLTRDPFREYEIKKEETTRSFLTKDEIRLLMEGKLKNAKQELYRDLYLFCAFTGLSFADMRNLTEENIRTYFDEHEWININRQKTGVVSNIRLLDIANRIIGKYRGLCGDGRIFPVPHYNTCLAGIRAVAKRCGITKHITWHQSRHTAATTIFLSNGVPIETVSSMLGHKSIKTTQIYAKITKEKLNQDMENLAARLNGVEEFAGCTI